MSINFPIEFIVSGTPVSFQRKSSKPKLQWKQRVKRASNPALPARHSPSADPISVTLFYLPSAPMQGDVDNIIKLVLDALCNHVFKDDSQVERVVVQKFEPGKIFAFSSPTAIFLSALTGAKPVLYVRVSDNPSEDLK